jgi:flagellar hook-basal body complex protein FliE
LKAGETAAVGGILGQTPINEVADAVMSAQRTLQAALSIRDKAVSAFQEITRMTI